MNLTIPNGTYGIGAHGGGMVQCNGCRCWGCDHDAQQSFSGDSTWKSYFEALRVDELDICDQFQKAASDQTERISRS